MSFINAVYQNRTQTKSKVKAIRKVKHLIKLIQDDGWYLHRTRGSHRHFKHPVKSGIVTVAKTRGSDIPVGTLNSALRQAGLK